MRVEVIYAKPGEQFVAVVDVEYGATIADAIAAAKSTYGFPPLDISLLRVGIFGTLAEPQTLVADGDRVEIYRALQFDPMQSRRRRAAKKKPGSVNPK